jgi:Cu-Zn family superoxide dismutase
VDPVSKPIGVVNFVDSPAGLLIFGTISGLGIGSHGVHLHQIGRCEPPFTTTGGHFNPRNRQHGFRNPQGSHAGDLPNVITPGAGSHSFEMLAAGLSVSALLDSDGASIVFHAASDDHVTNPDGDTGARIGCGVITRN